MVLKSESYTHYILFNFPKHCSPPFYTTFASNSYTINFLVYLENVFLYLYVKEKVGEKIICEHTTVHHRTSKFEMAPHTHRRVVWKGKKRYVYISYIMLSFSLKGLELQLAACRLSAWHEGTSINHGTGHKGLKMQLCE